VSKIVGLTILLIALAVPAWTQEKYPDRPIDFICTWGVGGGADQMARTVGKLAEKFLGVAIPVSNVPGSSGIPAWPIFIRQGGWLHDCHLYC